jgi:hypothetical protein
VDVAVSANDVVIHESVIDVLVSRSHLSLN